MTLTIKRDGNWSSFQLANSALPLSVTSSAIAPSARMQTHAGIIKLEKHSDFTGAPNNREPHRLRHASALFRDCKYETQHASFPSWAAHLHYAHSFIWEHHCLPARPLKCGSAGMVMWDAVCKHIVLVDKACAHVRV